MYDDVKEGLQDTRLNPPKVYIDLVQAYDKTVAVEIRADSPGTIEWWSDHDEIKSEIDLDTKPIRAEEPISHPGYMTIYAGYKNRPKSITKLENIVVPFKYCDISVDHLSGTSCTIRPVFDSAESATAIYGVSWIFEVNDENNQTFKGRDGGLGKVINLSPGKEYSVHVQVQFDNRRDNNLSFVHEYDYTFKTYACYLYEYEITTNSFKSKIEQIVGEINSVRQDIKTYKGFAVKLVNGEPQDEIVGNIEFKNNIAHVTKLKPDTSYRLYVYLNNCQDNVSHESDAVGYIDFHTKSTARLDSFRIKTTGTSASLTPVVNSWGWASYITGSIDVFLGSEKVKHVDDILITRDNMRDIVIDSLLPGKKYTLVFSLQDNENNILDMPSINTSIVTYGIFTRVLDSSIHTTYLSDVIIDYIEGRSGQTFLGKLPAEYIIKRVSDNEIVESGIISENTLNTVKGSLYQDTEYELIVYLKGSLYNGENDTVHTSKFKTAIPAKSFTPSLEVTGTSAKIRLSYIKPTSKGYHLRVMTFLKCGGDIVQMVETTDDDIIIFRDLNYKKTYTCVITLSDNEDNTSADGSLTKPREFNINLYNTLIKNIKTSSCAVEFTPLIGNPNLAIKPLEYRIENKNQIAQDWVDCVNNQKTIFTGLYQNSECKISVRVKDMLNPDSEPDTTYSTYTWTKTLNVKLLDHGNNLTSITANFQPYLEDKPVDVDPVTGREYVVSSNTEAINGVQHVKGVQIGPKQVRFDNLYRELKYEIVISITDGYNESLSSVYQYATRPNTVKIYDDTEGVFKNYKIFIYHKNKFIPSKGFIYHNGHWVETA